MSDTGWVSPGTVDGSPGYDNSWVNPDNIKTSNDAYTTVSALPDWARTTARIYCTNFGFSIPEGNIPVAVEVEIEGYEDGGSFSLNMGLYINETRDTTGPDTKPSIGGTEQYYTFGAADEDWGGNYSRADVNSSTFGVFLWGNLNAGETIYLDHLRMKVYYTEGGTPTVGEKYALPAFKRP